MKVAIHGDICISKCGCLESIEDASESMEEIFRYGLNVTGDAAKLKTSILSCSNVAPWIKAFVCYASREKGELNKRVSASHILKGISFFGNIEEAIDNAKENIKRFTHSNFGEAWSWERIKDIAMRKRDSEWYGQEYCLNKRNQPVLEEL